MPSYKINLRIDTASVDWEAFLSDRARVLEANLSGISCPHNRTKINDLFRGASSTSRAVVPQTVSFLDESKLVHTCLVTLSGEVLNAGSVCCFWCSHAFDTVPLGLPIDYVPHKVMKMYLSEITKDKYVLYENMGGEAVPKRVQTSLRLANENYKMSMMRRDYYVVDGVFCSFNCALAFYEDHRHNPMYRSSRILLHRLWRDCFGPGETSSTTISPAPSWRLLRKFGGPLSIEKFRDSFFRVEYKDMEQYMLLNDRQQRIGFMYEEHVSL
jgi:hypothetical protein